MLGQETFALEQGLLFPKGARGMAPCVCVSVCAHTRSLRGTGPSASIAGL